MTQQRTLRALVVDDEALARDRLAAMLREVRDITIIGMSTNGAEAVEMIARMRPDIVFLDVQMPGLDGFGVLRCTAGLHRPAVIFVTAFDEHAIRAFDVHAVDYLLKPVSQARLHEAVRRAVGRVRGDTHDTKEGIEALLAATTPQMPASRIAVRAEGMVQLLNPAEIEWVEAMADHVVLHLGARRIVLRDTMSEMADRLRPFGFHRVHRSALVNQVAVRQVESIPKGDYILVLRTGTRIRTSRSYRRQVQAFMKQR